MCGKFPSCFKKNWKWIMIGVLLLLIVCIGIVIAVVLFR